MQTFLSQNEAILRLIFFFGIFFIFAAWEIVTPRRKLSISKTRRWINNIAIVIINSFLLRLIFPTAAVGFAFFAQTEHWGLLNQIKIPEWISVTVAVVTLDLIIYLQHVMFHAVPLLWRLHIVHHTDLDLDVTSGTRFHPVEILLSMIIKFAAIAALGPPVIAVFAFEILLNATAMFNHSNIFIPLNVDKKLRYFVVTPDMHRVHHSVLKHETNSNFGFNLPWWDRLFGTYRDQPTEGHTQMIIGLEQYRNPEELSLIKLILLPLCARTGPYPIINRGNRNQA
ncbi:MAG: sterol desaturase family protein [Gammaproteobacteria bacterium]